MRWTAWIAGLAACVSIAGCGGGATRLIIRTDEHGLERAGAGRRHSASPSLATKNTTRVSGRDPIDDAAGVALAVFPSQVAGTHPAAVTIAPTDDWEAAIAASVLMAPPIRAPILLSGSAALPTGHHQRAQPARPDGLRLDQRSAGDPHRRRPRGQGPAQRGDRRDRAVRADRGDRQVRERRRRQPESPTS